MFAYCEKMFSQNEGQINFIHILNAKIPYIIYEDMHFFLFTVGTECPDMTEIGLLLDQSCHRNYNETCLYTCKPVYRPTHTTQPHNVTCTTSSAWDRPLSSLCEKIKCPAKIPNGNISTICSREYDSICYSYRCNSGFLHPTDWPGLTCNASGHWEGLEYSTRDFCLNESDLCPSVIKNGNISARCSRYEGDVCAFYCDGGCKHSSNINALTCHNRTWNFESDLLCTHCVQCSMAKPHGSVYRANCYAVQTCSYCCIGNLKRRKMRK